MNKSKVIKKWTPVFENMGLKNRHLIEVMCLFAEDFHIRAGSDEVMLNSLPEKIHNLLDVIKNKRQPVKQTYYNPISGRIEYELENGLIINDYNQFENELTTSDIIQLFGVEFAMELDKVGFREEQLNKILDGRVD